MKLPETHQKHKGIVNLIVIAARRAGCAAVQLGVRGVEKTHGLASFSLVFEEQLSWPAFEQAIAVLPALRGPDLLRVKARVAIAELGRSSSILSSMSPPSGRA